MRKIANTFLVLFLLSAIISLVSEGIQLFSNFSIPALFVQFIWSACFTCAAILYIGIGFNRHLPRLILLPPQLWMLWSLLNYWPLEPAVGSHYNLYAFITQLILALIVLQLNRVINGQSLFLINKQFSGPAFEGSRLLKFALANVFIFPILLFLVLFSLTSNFIEEGSAGFVRLKPNGLYMVERTYRQADKQIQMMGMIHLARSQYYTDLIAAIPQKSTLLLLEGVTDREELLKEQFSYGKVAELMGLTSQKTSHFQGRLISKKSLIKLNTNENLEIDLLPADIDLSRFDPLTIKVLNALAKKVLNTENPLAGYAEFGRWAEQNIPENFDKVVMNDLLSKRNRHLISYFPAALKKYDNLVIPWGALHMKELEQAVLERGFEQTASREHLSIDFLLLPFDQWWDKLTS
jgi:hypothetical protein